MSAGDKQPETFNNDDAQAADGEVEARRAIYRRIWARSLSQAPVTAALETHAEAPDPLELPLSPVGTEEKLTNHGAKAWRKRVCNPQAAQRLADENDPEFGNGREQRSAWYTRIAEDEHAGWRDLCQPTEERLASLENLAGEAGHAGKLFTLLLPALRAALAADRPVDLPPVLMIGEPGLGKTYLAHEIARRLNIVPKVVSLPNQSSTGVFSGLDPSWRNAKIGQIAQALIMDATASPIFILDEIDKAMRSGDYGDVLGPLYDLWEKQTAKSFEDDYLKLCFAADRVIWFATANNRQAIAKPLLDRAFIIEIPTPSAAQIMAILRSIYRDLIAKWGDWFGVELSHESLTVLGTCSPRQARKILDLAMTHAVAQYRHAVDPDDIRHAIQLSGASPTQRYGFV
ncbi:AAA family ATPase [Rhabdaerophilum calidifontis]|uniref:AAA family ATPase n=1 Tax=Rhabdaerophilum calidifontis TaxID=2604328 RepID=UPI00140A3F36|nr:AAA family ATPase [Rhabdaerophilum calidifontis]